MPGDRPDFAAFRGGICSVAGIVLRPSTASVGERSVFGRICERPPLFHCGFRGLRSARALDVPFGGVFGRVDWNRPIFSVSVFEHGTFASQQRFRSRIFPFWAVFEGARIRSKLYGGGRRR